MEKIYTMHTLHEPPMETMPIAETEKPMPPTTESPTTSFGMELAQAYVRPQPLDGIFSPAEGLRHGTAFPNLSQPYLGRMVVQPC